MHTLWDPLSPTQGAEPAPKFAGNMPIYISHDLVRSHQVRDSNITLRDCKQSESEQTDLRRAPSSTHRDRVYPTSRLHRNDPGVS